MPIIQRSTAVNPIIKTLVPTKLEILGLVSLSTVVLVLLNAVSAIQRTNGGEYTQVTDYVKQITEKFLEPTEGQLGTQMFTLFFWMVVGILSYLLVWSVVTMIMSYSQDKPWNGRMILPNGFKKDRANHEVLTRVMIRLLSLIGLLAWLYLFLTRLLPTCSGLFLDSVTNFSLESVPKLVFSVLSLAASFFVITLLTRFIVLRSRVFELS